MCANVISVFKIIRQLVAGEVKARNAQIEIVAFSDALFELFWCITTRKKPVKLCKITTNVKYYEFHDGFINVLQYG